MLFLFQGKWNPNTKVHFLRPDAIPSKNLPIISHQNLKPVIDRSKRKILYVQNVNNFLQSILINVFSVRKMNLTMTKKVKVKNWFTTVVMKLLPGKIVSLKMSKFP